MTKQTCGCGCNAEITQPPTGGKRKYAGPTCKQRAYLQRRDARLTETKPVTRHQLEHTIIRRDIIRKALAANPNHLSEELNESLNELRKLDDTCQEQ